MENFTETLLKKAQETVDEMKLRQQFNDETMKVLNRLLSLGIIKTITGGVSTTEISGVFEELDGLPSKYPTIDDAQRQIAELKLYFLNGLLGKH